MSFVSAAITSNLRASNPPNAPPQPAWANVIFQVQFEGTDGANITEADEAQGGTWTSGGSVQPVYDDAQTKFNTTSARFNGGSNGYTFVPNIAAQDIGTQDFMCEVFLRYEDVGSDRSFCSVWHSSTGRQWRWYYDFSAGAIAFDTSSTGTNIVTGPTVSWSPSTGVWYHAAVSREGTTLRFFIDGVQIGGDQTLSADIYYDGVRGMLCGTNNDTLAVMDGWMESPRFVVGEAVYTSNFTPPTQHHPIGA